jgi:hypothetical protein
MADELNGKTMVRPPPDSGGSPTRSRHAVAGAGVRGTVHTFSVYAPVSGQLQRKRAPTSTTNEMDDRYAEFLIAVCIICDAAQRARLGVAVRTVTGIEVAGVPAIGAATAGDKLADTGYARTLRIDDARINVDEVVSCTINAPDR